MVRSKCFSAERRRAAAPHRAVPPFPPTPCVLAPPASGAPTVPVYSERLGSGSGSGRAVAEDLEALLARLAAKREQIRRAPPCRRKAWPAGLTTADCARARHHRARGQHLDPARSAEVLEHGTTIPGKLLREQVEVVNTLATWQWLSRRDPHAALSEAFVREVPRRLMQGILGEEADWHRRAAMVIRGSRHVPPNWVKVPELMAQWVGPARDAPSNRVPPWCGPPAATSSWPPFTHFSMAMAALAVWGPVLAHAGGLSPGAV